MRALGAFAKRAELESGIVSDTGITASGKVGDNGLLVAKDIY